MEKIETDALRELYFIYSDEDEDDRNEKTVIMDAVRKIYPEIIESQHPGGLASYFELPRDIKRELLMKYVQYFLWKEITTY